MMVKPFRNHRDIARCLALAGLALLVCLPMVIWQKIPQTDMRNYYIPMIQAVASRNWAHAYWPLIPPLFPTFAGILAMIFPITAFTAAKLASSLFFAGTVFPLYFLNLRVFGHQRIATGAVLLYIFCDRLLRYGGGGGLDSGKVFFLTLSVFLLIECIHKPTGLKTLGFSFSLAGLSLIRGEGIAVAAVLGGLFLVAEWHSNKKSRQSPVRRLIPVNSLFVLVLTAVLFTPWLMYQYTHTGYPVVDSRQIKFLPFKDIIKNRQELLLKPEPVALTTLRSEPDVESGETQKKNLWDGFFEELIKGVYPLYFLLYVPVIFCRIRKKKWTLAESLLLALGFIHTAILVISLWGNCFQKRYVIAVLPLFLGWAAIGYFRLWDKASAAVKNHHLRLLPRMIVGAVILGMLWSGTSRTRPSSKVHKRNRWALNQACVQWITHHASTYVPVHFRPLKSNQQTYHSGQLPTIVGSIELPVFMSRGEVVCPSHFRHRYTPAQLVRLCKLTKAQFVVIDKEMVGLGIHPEDLLAASEFVLLQSLQAGEQAASIFGFRENLAPAE